MFYYLKGNAYKLYNVQEISTKETMRIKEERKWLNKKDIGATGIKILATSVILFVVGHLLR